MQCPDRHEDQAPGPGLQAPHPALHHTLQFTASEFSSEPSTLRKHILCAQSTQETKPWTKPHGADTQQHHAPQAAEIQVVGATSGHGGGQGGGTSQSRAKGCREAGGPTEAVAPDTPKAPSMPWGPVDAPSPWATLSWLPGTTASVTEFHPLTVTSGSLPSVSPQIKWEDFEAPLESCPALMHGRPDT